jgi:hypothetical protein
MTESEKVSVEALLQKYGFTVRVLIDCDVMDSFLVDIVELRFDGRGGTAWLFGHARAYPENLTPVIANRGTPLKMSVGLRVEFWPGNPRSFFGHCFWFESLDDVMGKSSEDCVNDTWAKVSGVVGEAAPKGWQTFN